MGVREVRVRIVKAFGGYKVGQEFDWGDGMARVLVARGLVRAVEDRDEETAAVEVRTERAVQPQGKKRHK
jgi:hypothetical protein